MKRIINYGRGLELWAGRNARKSEEYEPGRWRKRYSQEGFVTDCSRKSCSRLRSLWWAPEQNFLETHLLELTGE